MYLELYRQILRIKIADLRHFTWILTPEVVDSLTPSPHQFFELLHTYILFQYYDFDMLNTCACKLFRKLINLDSTKNLRD